MREQIEMIAGALETAHGHVQELEIQSTRNNVLHLSGCLAALEEAMEALQRIEIPEQEDTGEEATEDV